MTSTQRPDYSEYTLRLASSTQEQEHWRAQFVPWHLNRTWEAFHADCSLLRDSLGPHKVFKTWALVRRDDYDGRIYSGVETYRRRASVRDKGSNQIREAWTYGVASVVTPVDQHRRGFASHMLKLLHYCIGDQAHLPPVPSAWGSPPSLSEEERCDVPAGVASALYSDVGSTFYERCTIGQDLPGWVMREEENQEVVWQVQPPVEGKKWDWLYLADVQEDSELAKRLQKHTRAGMESSDDTRTLCANDATTPMLLSSIPTRCLDSRSSDWIYKRNEEPVGVRLPSADGSDPAIVLFTWSTRFIIPGLLVTHISGLGPDQLPDALEAMDAVVHQAGMKEGRAWGVDPDAPLVQKWKDLPGRKAQVGRRAEVEGHLLCVAWYGDAADRGVYCDTDMWTWC